MVDRTSLGPPDGLTGGGLVEGPTVELDLGLWAFGKGAVEVRRFLSSFASFASFAAAALSLLGRGATILASTNLPIHNSVPGYDIGPIVKVTLDTHSIS